MVTHYDVVIVGAGFTGAVLAERLASGGGKKVLVVDRRSHIAGNAFDLRSQDGILYHQYGPHIFHTNSTKVSEYLSRFTEWTPYEHRVVGLIDGRLVPIPFNLTSLAILYPQSDAKKLSDLLIETYGMGQKVPILKMREAASPALRELANFIYANVFEGYTKKQWGLGPDDLSPSVTARVPIHVSYDDRYFQDTFQNMPHHGYTQMFRNMLRDPRIHISLNTSFKDIEGQVTYDRLVFTGAIDEYFGYVLGELPYRSLQFDFRAYQQARHQPVAQVNYPVSHDFTRITEMGHLTQEWGDRTMVAIEYARQHVPGQTEPYYPIPRDDNTSLHRRYMELARREAPNVLFCGRLGEYRYYNMDQVIARALHLYEKGLVDE